MRRTEILGTCLAVLLAAAPVVAQQGQAKGPKGQQGARATAVKSGSKAQAQKPGNERQQAQKPGNAPQQAQNRGKPAEKPKVQPQGRGNAGQPAQGQGQGRGNARGQDRAQDAPGSAQRGQGRAQGQGSDAVRGAGAARAANPRGNRAARAEARGAVNRLPQSFRALRGSDRRSDRLVLGAAALAAARALDPNVLDLRRANERIEVRNRRGDILFDMDEDRARRLGSWDLRLLGDREPRANAPAFCRSGAGHPVWGREWCLDKGFGLGRTNDRYWSRTTTPGDIIWGRTTDRDRLERRSIIDVVGDVVFGRLALHALSLGFDQPLTGRWVAEPAGPRLLLIDAGPEPVAEFVDWNGDDRVDVLYVTHYGY